MKTATYDRAEKEESFMSAVSQERNARQAIKKSKQKVLRVLEEWKDQSITRFSDLEKKRTCAIGFLLPDIANSFHAELARQVEGRAHEAGYNLIICSTNFQQEKEAN